MSKCIYCGQAEAHSREHYMPACMGAFRKFEPLVGKVCSECNNKIGLLEEQFCRCGPEAFFREIKGIKGRKHHKKPSPFYRGSAGGKRMVAKAKHPYFDYEILCEVVEGGEEVYPARQIVVVDKGGKHHPILITEQIQEPEDLRKELETRGLSDCKFVECWTAGPEDEECFAKLCKGFNVGISWSETAPYKTEKRRVVTTLTVTDNYFRAIAKIAFHYCLKQFTQFTGFEKEFHGIKNFIMRGDDADKWVKQVDQQFVYQLRGGLTTDKYVHILSAEKHYRMIVARLQFFVGPRLVPRPYEVFIGENSERIYYPQSIMHQFVYFEQPDKEGYWGIMQRGKVISKKLVL